MTPIAFRDKVLSDGFAIVPAVLDAQRIKSLISLLDGLNEFDSAHRRGGIRNLLKVSPEIRAFADSPALRDLVTPVLGNQAFPVRGILFDKTPEANWKVPWHQDLTIEVYGREELEGFGPWSMKGGIQHVQPPVDVLENMLSVRAHLDPCGPENGALKVIAGSHKDGCIPEMEAARIAANNAAITCSVDAGDTVLMRPLLLHASSASEVPAHRRVIHLDFASVKLPGGLKWLVHAESQ